MEELGLDINFILSISCRNSIDLRYLFECHYFTQVEADGLPDNGTFTSASDVKLAESKRTLVSKLLQLLFAEPWTKIDGTFLWWEILLLNLPNSCSWW